MTVLPTPSPALPGSYGLAKIRGVTGRLVGALQAAGNDGSAYTHAFLILDRSQVVEAEPDGARIVPLQPYLDRHAADPDSVVFCDGPIRRRLADYGGGDPDGHLEGVLRRMVAAAGRSLEGTGYSFADYGSLALLHTLGPTRRPRWLTRYVESSGHLICSALVDRAFSLAGIQLWDDGRQPGDVMPADLDAYRVDWLTELVGAAA